jgi:ribosomal protein S18 acetylase RimI-like enzyme
MNARLTQRQAGPDDAQILRAIYASTRQDELALSGWTEAQRSAFLAMQFSAQEMHFRSHYPDAECCVVEWAGRVIGRLYVERRKGEIQLIDIALLADFRGQGLGRELLQGIVDEAAACGATVSLHVARGNRAAELYARLGFREVDCDAVYRRMKWTAEH